MNSGLTASLSSAPLRTRAAYYTINGSLVLAPIGPGAIFAAPTGQGDGASLTFLTPRGRGSVDLQVAHTSATQVASGLYSTIAGGRYNTASGESSFAVGDNNTASGVQSFAAGSTNTASGTSAFTTGADCTASGYCAAAIGRLNQATADYSLAIGREAVSNRMGQISYSAGNFASVGDGQFFSLVMRMATSSTAAVECSLDGTAVTGTVVTTSNRLIIEANSVVYVDAVFSWRDTSGNCGGGHRRCLIKRDGAGVTALVGTQQTVGTDITTDGTCGFDLIADDTNESLQVQVTPASATSTRHVVDLQCRLIKY